MACGVAHTSHVVKAGARIATGGGPPIFRHATAAACAVLKAKGLGRTPVDPDAASAVGHAGFLRADRSRQSIGFSGFSGFVQEPAPEESRRESTDWRYANGKRQPSEVRPQAWERGQLEERRGTHYYGTNGIARCRPASGS
jgi:hypothetical protein